jgi:glycosyltransferase involved in cell wall biosynthesis
MHGLAEAATTRGAQHLAILLPDLSGGGAERVAVVLANAAAARGLRTSLVVLRATGPLRDAVSPRVGVVELGCASTRASIRPLRSWMQAERPDALMVTPSHLGWAACVAAAGLRPSIRIVVREASTLSVDLAMMPRLSRIARLLAERILAGRASRIALCDYCADDLARTLGIRRNHISVVPNPVISDVLHSAAQATERPSRQGIPVLLAAGRLVHQKGFDVLVRAFAILRRARPARLVIAGAGPELQSLQRIAQVEGCADDIEFAGYVADLRGSMRQASVFVLPSRWEGLPGVLIESLALGTPVVATDCPGGSREILEEGRWGELVPMDDPQALAAAIGRTLDAPSARPDRAWMQRYSVDAAVSGYLASMGLARS